MQLCVGAVSKIVIEEAAKLNVSQIVASRRQINGAGGYVGLNQAELVLAVRRHSAFTHVVRDHGGPRQNGSPDDDCVPELDEDVAAGFDALHLDVSLLDRDDQAAALEYLLRRYRHDIRIEIGGERDEQAWLDDLLEHTMKLITPTYCVVETGCRIWADRQCGEPHSIEYLGSPAAYLHRHGILAKGHNADFMGDRVRYRDVLDAYNVAPEFANVEIDAWLHVMSLTHGRRLLDLGFASNAWRRWFDEGQGTWLERARCGVRYVMNTPNVLALLDKYREDEGYVRGRVRDALVAG